MTTKLNHTASQAAFARALDCLPGGVNSPARAFGAVGGTPLFIERGQGAYLYDIDGNCYLDYIGSWGPMILGHGHPAVVDALQKALLSGTSFGAPTEAESELAELIIEAVPSVEKVRLVNSGTEATMSAIRLARGYTGRNLIVKFAGNYHGHVDSLLVSAGSAAATLGVPNSPGVTPGTVQDTLVLSYNDVAGLEQAFQQYGPQIAGVILEPVVGNMGVVVPTPAFLQSLRSLTTEHGALLIMDEVMTGFRVARGGAQSIWGITPDLTTLGKIVGGGLPVGAYGGRAEIMNHVLPAGQVFQAGTLSGNPLATAAGIATLRTLRDEPSIYAQLELHAQALAAGLTQAAQKAGIPAVVARVGSMLTLFFTTEELAAAAPQGFTQQIAGVQPSAICDWHTASQSDTARYAQYFWAMITRGVYLPCSQYEALFISAAHTSDDIAATIEAAEASLASL